MMRFGKYHVCLIELFMDEKGRLSSTKTWLHVANVIMSKIMLEQKEVGWELLATYGAIVGGSYLGAAIITRKWKVDGGSQDDDLDDDGDKDDDHKGKKRLRGGGEKG